MKIEIAVALQQFEEQVLLYVVKIALQETCLVYQFPGIAVDNFLSKLGLVVEIWRDHR